MCDLSQQDISSSKICFLTPLKFFVCFVYFVCFVIFLLLLFTGIQSQESDIS